MSFLTSSIEISKTAMRTYRPDIDGLKAIAVLSVIFFHYGSRFIPGGFVGVDVFFVISGYLIGRSTFIEVQCGKYQIAKYFGRRALRIFPSLILLLLCLLIVGALVLLPDEYKSLTKHIAAASVFISNWLLWREIGYFDTSADEKPLLNLWSLGVEEQFYLVFPTILFLGLRLKKQVVALLGILLVFSFLVSASRVSDHAGWAYYHPVSRLWELLAGTLLAYWELHKRFTQLNNKYIPLKTQLFAKNSLSFIGFLLIITSVFFYSRETIFPGLAATLPVVGALCLIAASEEGFINKRCLKNPLLVYVGLISYPLYLWHWPLVSLATIIDSKAPPLWLVSILLVSTFILSMLSYHFIEKPIRFGHMNRKKMAISLWLILLLIGGLSYYLFKRPYTKPEQITIGNHQASQTTSSPQKIVALIGNSHAGLLKDVLTEYFSQKGYELKIFDQGGCTPFWNLDRQDPGHGPQGCERDINRGIEFVLSTPVADTVVFAARLDEPGNIYDISRPETNFIKNGDKPGVQSIWPTYESAMNETFEKLAHAHKRVIVIETVPTLDFDPKECINRPIRLASVQRSPCVISRESVQKSHATYRKILERTAKRYPNVEIFDPFPIFCDSLQCHAEAEGKGLYHDRDHLNDFGVRFLAPSFNF